MSNAPPTPSPTASRLWPRLRRPAQALALLLWIGATANLVAAGFGDGALELPRVRRPLKPGVTEYRAVLGDREVGSVRTEVSEQDAGWRVRTETEIESLPGNNRLSARYDLLLGPDFETRRLEAAADTAFGEIRATGAPRADGSLEIRVRIDKSDEVVLALPPGTGAALSEGLLQNVAVRDLVPGRRYRVPLVSPGTGSTLDATVEVQNVDLWPEGRLFHLLIRHGDGPPLRAQVYENGEVLMQELPFGVTLVRRSPEDAP